MCRSGLEFILLSREHSLRTLDFNPQSRRFYVKSLLLSFSPSHRRVTRRYSSTLVVWWRPSCRPSPSESTYPHCSVGTSSYRSTAATTTSPTRESVTSWQLRLSGDQIPYKCYQTLVLASFAGNSARQNFGFIWKL